MSGGEGLTSLVSSISPILELVGGLQQASAARRAAELEAQRLEGDREAERRATERQRITLAEDRKRSVSRLRAQAAGQGFRVDEGAPLIALEEQLFEFERAFTTLEENSQVRQIQLSNQAAQVRFEGSQQSSAGIFGAAGGFLTKGIKFFTKSPTAARTTKAPFGGSGPDPFMLGGAPF